MLSAVRRARVGVASLAALALVTAIATACIAVVGAAASLAFDRGVDGMLAAADPRARLVVVELPLDPRDATQPEALSSAIDDALAGLNVAVHRTTAATATATVDGAAASVGLLADESVPDRAELASGAWPATGDDVALGEPAARRLGLTAGDLLSVDGAELRVSGVWRADDPTDLSWSGDSAVASGMVDGVVGPVLMHDAATLAGAPRLRARWTVAPEVLTAGSAAELRTALDRIDAAAAGPAGVSNAGPVEITGGLGGTLARILAAVAGARIALTVPLVAFAVIAAVIAGVVVFALGRTRERELALLVARGARRRRVWIAAVAEITVAATLGAAVGALVAVVARAPTALPTAALCAAAAIGVGAAVAAASVLRAPGSRARRARSTTVGLLFVLVGLAVVAGLAVAQAFARAGLIERGGRVDPLAVAAPWLVLLTLCLLVSLLTGPVAVAAERVTRRGRGLAARLGVLQLARRPHSVLAGVLCLALAAGVLALAATLATGARASADAAAAAVGADLRADLDASRTVDALAPAPSVADLRAEPGVAGAEPALSTAARVGDLGVDLVATGPEAFAAMGADDETDALLDALPAVDAALVTGDTLTVQVTGEYAEGPVPSVVPRTPTMSVGAWAVDGAGSPRRIEVGIVPADGETHTLAAGLDGAARLLAVDVVGHGFAGGNSATVRLEVADDAGRIGLEPTGTALTSTRALRYSAVDDLPAEVPAVVSTALAARVDASVGSILHVDVQGASRPVTVRVEGIADFLPGVGSGPGVAVDLATLTAWLVGTRDAVLSPTTVLVDASDLAEASAAVRSWAAHPVQVAFARDAATSLAQPVLALFVGVALAGAVLGVLGFAVVMAAAARDRRAEAVPLRSFGFDRAAQRRARVAETAAASLFAITAGLLAGWATAEIISPVLLPSLTGMTA
ncbi:FtsX-like permease family protein [Microbacterium sp. B2969]|uniref:FtsX-like permease family protein n=1 Tax=Microbacterium alkaliflavum TaxID=3248839 RepID=A0ABW7QBU7_9MICO